MKSIPSLILFLIAGSTASCSPRIVIPMPGQMATPVAEQSTSSRDQKEAERMTKSLAGLLVPPKSYYTAIIKKPTGKNGLEEYLKCVDAVRASDAGKYTTAISDVQYNERAASINKMPVPEWAVGKSPAELRHEQTKRFEKLLDLITKGNQKPVEDPLLVTMTSPEHAALEFPMYAGFKSITKLAVNVADAHISDGDTRDASSRLIDQLRFSHKIRELGILADLVGIAMDAIVCHEIENRLVDFKGEIGIDSPGLRDWISRMPLPSSVVSSWKHRAILSTFQNRRVWLMRHRLSRRTNRNK